MTIADIPQLQQLTKNEKIQLVEDLWDSIATVPDDLKISEEEKAILNARLQAHQKSPDSVLSLDEFKKKLSDLL